MKKSLPALTHNHLPSPIYQSACVVCDDHGVEFTVAESAWSLEDVHYASPALERLSQYEPCGFSAGAWVGMGRDCVVWVELVGGGGRSVHFYLSSEQAEPESDLCHAMPCI